MTVAAKRRPRPAANAAAHPATARASGRERLAESLFPTAPPRPVDRRRVALAVGAVLAGTALGLTRTPGPGAFNTIWAEDGNEFLTDALNLRTHETLFKGLNGYFVLVPRLLAEPTTVLPLEWAPVVLSTGAALVTALLALAVYVACRAHLRSPLLRLLVAAPVVFTPVGALYTVNNVATLQFVALYATFWMLLWVPATRAGRAVALTIVTLTGLSTILTVLFVPLAVLRLLVRRDRWSAVLAATTVATCVIQFGSLATGANSRNGLSHPRFDPVWALVEYLRWGLPYSVMGEEWQRPRLVENAGRVTFLPDNDAVREIGLTAAAYVVVLVVVGLAVFRVTRPAWALSAVAAVHSVGMLALEMMAMGYATDSYLIPETDLIITERYLVPTALLVITALVALLRWPDGPARPTRRGLPVTAWPAIGYALLLVVLCAAHFRIDNSRGYTVPWTTAVAQARAECAVPTAKVGYAVNGGKVWYAPVRVPCHKLRA